MDPLRTPETVNANMAASGQTLLSLARLSELALHVTPDEAPPERIIIESQNDTVRLMQLTPKDAQAYYDLIAHDPDHLRKNGDMTADKYPTPEAVETSIRSPENVDRYRFGIWDNDKMVGSNNLTVNGDGTAEIGSWVGRRYIGRRYAARARLALLDFAFNTLGVRQVYCDIAVSNEPARWSVEETGFTYEREFINDMDDLVMRYVLDSPHGATVW